MYVVSNWINYGYINIKIIKIYRIKKCLNNYNNFINYKNIKISCIYINDYVLWYIYGLVIH